MVRKIPRNWINTDRYAVNFKVEVGVEVVDILERLRTLALLSMLLEGIRGHAHKNWQKHSIFEAPK